MIDHVSLRVADFARALEFYRHALGPLGYSVMMEYPGAVGMGGSDGKPDFWIIQSSGATNPTHVAFSADRDTIDAFHIAAIAAGARDNGAPGLRPHYHAHYYGAFVIDPEGNNIEAVCHAAPASARAAAARPRKTAKKKPAKKPAAKKKPAARGRAKKRR